LALYWHEKPEGDCFLKQISELLTNHAFRKGHCPGSIFQLGSEALEHEQLFCCLTPPADARVFPLIEAYSQIFMGHSETGLYFFFFSQENLDLFASLLETSELDVLNQPQAPSISLIFLEDPLLLHDYFKQPNGLFLYAETHPPLPSEIGLISNQVIVLQESPSPIQNGQTEIIQLKNEKAILSEYFLKLTPQLHSLQNKITCMHRLENQTSTTYPFQEFKQHAIIGLGIKETNLASEQALVQVMQALAQLPATHRFCLIGHQGSAQELYQRIQNSELSENLLVYFDEFHPNYNEKQRIPASLLYHRSHLSQEPKPDWLLFYLPKEEETDHMRFYLRNLEGPFRFILPFLNQGYWPQETVENPAPVLLYLFPGAGSSRLGSPMTILFKHFEWTQRTFHPLNSNLLFNQSIPQNQVISLEQANQYVNNQIDSLDFYQYMIVHDPFELKSISHHRYLRKIILIRDPRDVLTSFYFREFVPQFGNKKLNLAEKEADFLALMETGYLNRKKNYYLTWPNLQTMSDIFVQATEAPHTLVIKFEDLHHQEDETYQKILDWLGFAQHPLIQLSPEKLKQYQYTGSIAFQTQGAEKKQNEDEVVEFQGFLTSCRKGGTGDWRNHFTPALQKRCLELIGPQLDRLGYSRT